MADLPELEQYDAGVYQLETTDPVVGGVNGVSNAPLKNVANRTKYLKKHVDDLESGATIPPTVAPLDSPAFTGDPTAPTAAAGDNDTSLATTAWAQRRHGGRLSKDVAGGTNVTLTADEAGYGILALTGTVTANIAVIVPTAAGRWIVENKTSGSFTVTVKTAAGTGALVDQGKSREVYCDGTNVYASERDFKDLAMTGTPTTPTATSGTDSTQVANAAFLRQTVYGRLAKDVAGGSTTTLTTEEAGYGMLAFTGLLTANKAVDVPAATKAWIVVNETTGDFALTLKTVAGTGVVLPRDESVFAYCDGTNVELAGAANENSFTVVRQIATAAQTTFNVDYTPGALIVFQNGALLDPTEYTATTGAQVVLDVGASENDELVFYIFKSFKVADINTYKTYSTSAEMIADQSLTVGQSVDWEEHTAGYGYGGGNTGLVVAGGTGTDDNATYFDLANGAQVRALFRHGITDKHFGAKHAVGTDDTAAVMAAYHYAGQNGIKLEISAGDIYITDQGGTGIALDWSDGYQNLKIKMRGIFQYEGGSGIALRIGSGTRMWNPEIEGIRVYATIQTPYENLVGTAIRFCNIGEGSFKDFRVQGFKSGYEFRPGANEGITINEFRNCNSQACYWPIYMEPTAADFSFITANKFIGGHHTVDPAQFNDIVAANAAMIYILNGARFTQSANTVDGNVFSDLVCEEFIGRKVICDGNRNTFQRIYFDTGVYNSGNTHASGNYPYRQSGITGFTSDGSSTITKVGHGLLPYLKNGDLINIGDSSADIGNKGQNFVILNKDEDTIELDKPVIGVGTLTIAHYSADIEFTANGEDNSIIECFSAGMQVITSVATTPNSQFLVDAEQGIVKGPFPPLGSLGSDNFPGGITDTPQPGLFSLLSETVGGAGTINAYLGNLNDEDTDADTQLCFVALDGSGRPSVFASILARKDGRSTSQAHGSIVVRTRAAGSNSYLVDCLEIASDGSITVLSNLTVNGTFSDGGLAKVQDNVTAFVGGGQANGTQITAKRVFVTSSGSSGESVKMPDITSAVLGEEVVIRADAGQDFALFPFSGDQFEGSAVDASIAITGGTTRRFVAVSSSVWKEL